MELHNLIVGKWVSVMANIQMLMCVCNFVVSRVLAKMMRFQKGVLGDLLKR
jgi:hypothetical protein